MNSTKHFKRTNTNPSQIVPDIKEKETIPNSVYVTGIDPDTKVIYEQRHRKREIIIIKRIKKKKNYIWWPRRDLFLKCKDDLTYKEHQCNTPY